MFIRTKIDQRKIQVQHVYLVCFIIFRYNHTTKCSISKVQTINLLLKDVNSNGFVT